LMVEEVAGSAWTRLATTTGAAGMLMLTPPPAKTSAGAGGGGAAAAATESPTESSAAVAGLSAPLLANNPPLEALSEDDCSLDGRGTCGEQRQAELKQEELVLAHKLQMQQVRLTPVTPPLPSAGQLEREQDNTRPSLDDLDDDADQAGASGSLAAGRDTPLSSPHLLIDSDLDDNFPFWPASPVFTTCAAFDSGAGSDFDEKLSSGKAKKSGAGMSEAADQTGLSQNSIMPPAPDVHLTPSLPILDNQRMTRGRQQRSL